MTDDQLLASPMQLEAAGKGNRATRMLARQQRARLRYQAFDDQVFAALLARYGGDEATAALYWRLSRTVSAITRGPATAKTVDEVLDFIADEYPDAEEAQ